MRKFEILITSPLDREKLAVEIWHDEILIAEINQEKENLEIELYQSGKIVFELEEFLEILIAAKKKLSEK